MVSGLSSANTSYWHADSRWFWFASLITLIYADNIYLRLSVSDCEVIANPRLSARQYEILTAIAWLADFWFNYTKLLSFVNLMKITLFDDLIPD